MRSALSELRPYPEYRESGLPWLGAIPAHWDVQRIKRFAKVGNGSTPSRGKIEYWSDTGFPWLNSASVHQEKITKASRFVTELAMRECHLPCLGPGCVLVAITGQGKTRGTAALLTFPATINQHIAYIAPRRTEVFGSYLRYFLTAAYRQLRGQSDDSGGTKGALTCEDMKQFEVAIPPTDEQVAIADFLDHHGQVVRRFIRNRRRLIDVLNEQKQAIIDRAITRGLDPNVRLKPSGVDWLGHVPEHWELRRLKYLARNINDQTAFLRDGEVYVALEHVQSWTGRITSPNSGASFDSQVKRFRTGDILFGKLRPYLAKVARPQQAGVCVGEFLVLRPSGITILPAFLEQKLRSKQIIDLVNSSTFGAKMPRADWTFIGNVQVAFPPNCNEQTAILDRIAQETATLTAAVERAQREIDLIQEYRTRIITDVVTGKMDVRHLAPDVHEAPAEEAEPWDEGAEDMDGSEAEELEAVEEAADGDD